MKIVYRQYVKNSIMIMCSKVSLLPYLLSSCPWPGTSGSGSTGTGSSVFCPPCSLCCPDRCKSGLYVLSAWRNLYSPRSCTPHSACLRDAGKNRGLLHLALYQFFSCWFQQNVKTKAMNVTIWLNIFTRGSVSANGTKAFLRNHGPWAVGGELLQAQWRFHIIGAAHSMKSWHGYSWVDLGRTQNRLTNLLKCFANVFSVCNDIQWLWSQVIDISHLTWHLTNDSVVDYWSEDWINRWVYSLFLCTFKV